jgi:hypothetical protein
MPNPQYYLICKQETRILVVLPILQSFSLLLKKENLGTNTCSKTLKSKRMDARWTRRRERCGENQVA